MGALNPYQAELDAAHATGYATGLAEGRDEALDDLQTLLSRILESRFGELDDSALDCIAEADIGTLKNWIISACAVEDLDDLFAR